MNICLVRHGQDEDNAADILNGRRNTPLTKLGVRQAKAVASQIDREISDVAAIYTSPLLRAQQTAKIIADKIGVNAVINEDDLIERDYGVLSGKSRSDIPKYSSDNLEVDGVLYFLNAENAETFPATYERAKRILKKIQDSYNSTVVMVAHRDICVMIQAAYNNWGWEEGLQRAHMDNATILLLKQH